MAINILSYSVGESDVAQPGDITTLLWDFAAVLGDNEAIASVAATATNRAGALVGDVIDDMSVADGARVGSVAAVRIHNLIDGERYKIQIVATVTVNEKVMTATVFVPVVAP